MPPIRLLSVTAIAATVCVSTVTTTPAIAAPETFPLSQVRRGQKGYGMTTMKGTKPERFEFEVIGVQKNFLPKMDIILVKSDDPKLQLTGFWQGMSGSPLYINGKLTCAFSYGYPFNKVPIGGCTPIEYMKREGFKPLRDAAFNTSSRPAAKRTSKGKKSVKFVRPGRAASVRDWIAVAPTGTAGSALAQLGPKNKSWLTAGPLPKPPRKPAGAAEGGMVASSVPLAMSGFSSPAFAEVKQLMADYPVVPMQGGGSGNANAGPTEFRMGASIAVQLIRGDMSMGSTGTVSYVDGNRVLGFGHPFFQFGEFYAPVAAAEVHTVIPSARSGFVVAQPMRELGALLQDRQSGIMADTALRTRMIPMAITIDAGNGRERERGTFNVEMLNNRFFSGRIASIVAGNAISHYWPDLGHVTGTIHSTVKVKGYPALKFTDYLYSSRGASELVGGARGVRVLVPLLMNPFAPIEVEHVKLDVKLDFTTNFGEIESIRLPVRELVPGKRTYVDVTMTQYNGKRIKERIPFDVPKRLAGSIVRLEVTSGDSVSPDVAPAQSVSDIMKNLRKLLPGNVFAVTLYSADEGVSRDGVLVRDLPASVADKLKTSSATGTNSIHRAISRSSYKTTRVVEGRKTMLVKVADSAK